MYDGMNLYRAVVAYSSPTTGDINVRIPAVLGNAEVLPISKIGRAAVSGTWEVPLIGSQTVVAVEDDRFSNVYMVYPNLAVISASSGGGEEPPPEPEPVSGVPSGVITQYAGDTAPTGWLFCHGQPLSKTGTYANLFTAIAYSYGGSGDTFYLPNLKGRIPIGLDSAEDIFDTLNSPSGTKSVTLTVNNIPQHNHTIGNHGHDMTHYHYVTGGNHGHGHSGYGGVAGIMTRSSLGMAGSLALQSQTTGGPTLGFGDTSSEYGGHVHGTEGPVQSNYTTPQTTTGTSVSGNTGNWGTTSPSAISTLPPYIIVNYIIKV